MASAEFDWVGLTVCLNIKGHPLDRPRGIIKIKWTWVKWMNEWIKWMNETKSATRTLIVYVIVRTDGREWAGGQAGSAYFLRVQWGCELHQFHHPPKPKANFTQRAHKPLLDSWNLLDQSKSGRSIVLQQSTTNATHEKVMILTFYMKMTDDGTHIL